MSVQKPASSPAVLLRLSPACLIRRGLAPRPSPHHVSNHHHRNYMPMSTATKHGHASTRSAAVACISTRRHVTTADADIATVYTTPYLLPTSNQPKWKSVCFLFLLPFFFPKLASSPFAAASALLDPIPPPPPPLPQAFDGVLRPLLSRRTPAPVYPGLKNVLVGLAATGSAGNPSARLLLLLFSPTDDVARDGMGETRGDAEDDPAHGLCPGFAPMRLDDAAGSAGNMVLFAAALFQLACLLTADRDDCAVELFSFNTRDPPCAVGPPLSDCPVADPGREG